MNIERSKELKDWVRSVMKFGVGEGNEILVLIDEAISRQSAKSEDVLRAMDWLETGDFETIVGDEEYTANTPHHPDTSEFRKTAITALQAYEPTIRKDRTVEEEVEAIEQYQPWVSAEVEKPKVGRPVLVTYIGHNDGKPYSDGVATWQLEEDGHKGGWFWEIDGCKVAVEITHWKPLPEPAKGE